MRAKVVIVVLFSILVFGAGIVLTIFALQDGKWLGVPFLWFGVLAVWGESVHIIINDYKKNDKKRED